MVFFIVIGAVVGALVGTAIGLGIQVAQEKDKVRNAPNEQNRNTFGFN